MVVSLGRSASRRAVFVAALSSAALMASALPSTARASIYLSLRPVTTSLPAGASATGTDLTGYTLTFPTKTTAQTFQYDIVVHITQGTTTAETGARSLGSLFGAVRTSSSGSVAGAHVAYAGSSSQVPTYGSPAPAFQLDPTNQLQSSAQVINPSTISAALPGTAAPANYGTGVNGTTLNGQTAPAVLGVGNQVTNFNNLFDNSIPQTAFGMTFAFGGAQGFAPYSVAASAGVVVARATVSLTSNSSAALASFSFVGGNGANGTTADQRWAQWYEGATAYSTNSFSAAATSAIRNSLNVRFATVTAITGDYNNDGFVDAADYTVWADHFGQTGTSIPGDGNNDGVVNAADYTVWADHFGQGTPPGGVAAVPEPLALSAALPIVALLRRRR